MTQDIPSLSWLSLHTSVLRTDYYIWYVSLQTGYENLDDHGQAFPTSWAVAMGGGSKYLSSTKPANYYHLLRMEYEVPYHHT